MLVSRIHSHQPKPAVAKKPVKTVMQKLNKIKSYTLNQNQFMVYPMKDSFAVVCSNNSEKGYASEHCSPDVLLNIMDC